MHHLPSSLEVARIEMIRQVEDFDSHSKSDRFHGIVPGADTPFRTCKSSDVKVG